VVLFDGHYIIQTLLLPVHCEMLQCKDICKLFLEKVTLIAKPITANHADIHIVFDDYEDSSIKAHTRDKRSGEVGHVHHIEPGRNITKN